MRYIHAMIIGVLLVMLAGCNSGAFVPPAGPYSATFFVDSAEVGSFTLTTGDGLLAGTGSLTHNGNDIIVSIAAVIDEWRINGSVSNELQGSGPFTGTFASSNACSGTFSFTDSLGTATTTGTWAAYLD